MLVMGYNLLFFMNKIKLRWDNHLEFMDMHGDMRSRFLLAILVVINFMLLKAALLLLEINL
jgi:hypothetical protein